MNTQQLIGLDEGNSIHVECQSMPLSRPRTEIIWYITGIGEITTGLDNPVYTLDVTDSTLTTTKRGLTYTGKRGDNGQSLYCTGNQQSTFVTSQNISLHIKCELHVILFSLYIIMMLNKITKTSLN